MSDARRTRGSNYQTLTVLLPLVLATLSIGLAEAGAAQNASLKLKVVPANVKTTHGVFTTTASGYSGGYDTVALYFAFPPSTKCQKTEAAMARWIGATVGLKKKVKKNHAFSYQVTEPVGETTRNRATGNYIACAWLYDAAKPSGRRAHDKTVQGHLAAAARRGVAPFAPDGRIATDAAFPIVCARSRRPHRRASRRQSRLLPGP